MCYMYHSWFKVQISVMFWLERDLMTMKLSVVDKVYVQECSADLFLPLECLQIL